MSQWKGYSPDNVLASDAGVEDGPQTAATSGALTYEPYYGLKAKPFSLSTDPRSLYKSPAHSAVLDDLLSAIRRREGIIVLTGEVGTGKTTLCRAALYQLDRKTFTTFVPDPHLSREDLLRMLLVDFGEVSVDDLRRGRMSNASRPDLSYQLYEFLTSLESVDAFAVLVIDEAQHLAQPLLEEIRALSELEAGRRLLQIVLVGQPELQTRLKQFQMRQIDQRVTMRCELRPLTREDLAGYVAHRLATVGGTKERIAFASAAIDLIHAASNGVPRLVNIICDRAMSHAQVERVSVIGLSLVSEAIDELQMVSGQISMGGQVVERIPIRPSAPEPIPVAVSAPPPAPVVSAPAPPVAAPVPPVAAPAAAASAAAPSVAAPASPASAPAASRTGLFDRRRLPAAPEAKSELHALLDIPATLPKREWEAAPDQLGIGASAAPVWKWRVDSEVRREGRLAFLKTAGLAVLAMAVVLIAGGIAVTAQRSRALPARAALPAQAPAPAPVAPAANATSVAQAAISPMVSDPSSAPAGAPATEQHSSPATGEVAAAIAPAAAASASSDTWVVQVGAFTSHDRSQSLVQRLTQSGFPAFEVPTEASRGLLYFVRVGPFKTAGEADEARAKLRGLTELENAFVRSVSSVP
jgi:type II secretory pathway predicted ATPase ExeA/cell division septation protein DedD